MKEFKCEICEKKFNAKRKLCKHINYNHNNTEKAFYCNICAKSFQAQNITSHNKSVHGGNCYNCKLCGKSFSNAGNLNKHILRVHEGHKDFKCEICAKSHQPFTHAPKN